MREYVLVTDSDTEIPYWFVEENHVPVFLMPYTLNDEEHLFDLGRHTDYKAFYEALRAGASATTATRPPHDIEEFFEAILKDHKDILYICFSSQLSSHYELALTARKNVLERYPESRIEIVDSVSIAMGAGLLVYHATRMWKEGMELDALVEWLETNKTRALHFFTVDSLMYLKRTGRLSAVSATLGSILDLKPVLLLTREGKIVAFDKIKGKKKIVKYLVEKVEQNYLPEDPICTSLVIVYHADSPEYAAQIEKELRERFAFKDVWVMDVGPVIGCHCGPGTLAVCMMGKERAQ